MACLCADETPLATTNTNTNTSYQFQQRQVRQPFHSLFDSRVFRAPQTVVWMGAGRPASRRIRGRSSVRRHQLSHPRLVLQFAPVPTARRELPASCWGAWKAGHNTVVESREAVTM
jgi:hypothetical protein